MQRSPLGRHSPALQEDEDAIRRRKLAAEKRVQERHRALLFEQRQKTKTTAEERQRLQQEMREREAKEMKRRQEELHRHLEWLERDKARKKEILSRQHAVSSRVANKPGTGFGSSTPRDLSYLNNLSKEQKVYDKKLSPPRPAFKANGTPTKRAPSMMTTSMYVPSSTPRRPPQPKPQVQKANKTTNLMTQSFYTPSRATGTPVSAPRPKPRTAPPVARAKLPPASPSKPKKAPTPVKQVIIEEVPVEPKKVVESAVVEIRPPLETKVEELLVESSFLEETNKKTVISSEEPVEEIKAVEEEQHGAVGDEKMNVVDHSPVLEKEEVREEIEEEQGPETITIVEKEDETLTVKNQENEEQKMESPRPAMAEKMEELIDFHEETTPVETATNLFDELAALNITSPMPNNEVIELDYSHDPIFEKENVETSHKSTAVHEEDRKNIEATPKLNGHHLEDFDDFLLPGAVPERKPAVEVVTTTLADELSALMNNGEKPESIEEAKLNTSRPPSPPVATKNDDLDEIQRRREEDQKHNDEIKARFAAVKARIGRVSPPNVNGNGLPPPAPPAAAPAPVDNGKPLSDSTAALLSRLTKMGALKSTKAAESLLTRHASDPKIEQAPEDPVSLL